MSLYFGRCPISKLTTHSPRMVNDQNHAHTPDSTQCDRAYGVQVCHIILHVSFPIHGMKFSFIMSIYQRACIDIKFSHMHIIQLSSNKTQKILVLGSRSNEATIRPQHLKHTTRQKNKYFILFHFFFSRNCISVVTEVLLS